MVKNSCIIAICYLLAVLASCKKDEVHQKASEILLSQGNDLAWSHGGNLLAIISNDSLFTIHKDGGAKKLIATGAFSKPSFSSNDEYILYQGFSAGYSIMLAKKDGSGSTELVGREYSPFQPEFSPDGTQISFIGQRMADGFSVYIVGMDGKNLHKVPNTGPYASIFQVPSWTPDGNRILFITGFDNDHDLYLIDVDGSNILRLENESLWEEYAVFVNTGTSLLFSSSGSIYRINTDATGLVTLTGNATCPRPSPDESWIAFSSYRDGEDGLYMMQPEGTEVKKLSSPYVAPSSHTWSPDGKAIAFLASRPGTSGNYVLGVYIVQVFP